MNEYRSNAGLAVIQRPLSLNDILINENIPELQAKVLQKYAITNNGITYLRDMRDMHTVLTIDLNLISKLTQNGDWSETYSYIKKNNIKIYTIAAFLEKCMHEKIPESDHYKTFEKIQSKLTSRGIATYDVDAEMLNRIVNSYMESPFYLFTDQTFAYIKEVYEIYYIFNRDKTESWITNLESLNRKFKIRDTQILLWSIILAVFLDQVSQLAPTSCFHRLMKMSKYIEARTKRLDTQSIINNGLADIQMIHCYLYNMVNYKKNNKRDALFQTDDASLFEAMSYLQLRFNEFNNKLQFTFSYPNTKYLGAKELRLFKSVLGEPIDVYSLYVVPEL